MTPTQKVLIVFGLLALLGPVGYRWTITKRSTTRHDAQHGDVVYHYERVRGTMTLVTATVDGRTYQPIPLAESGCLRVVSQQDFDGNGTTDALIEDITACGGNALGNSYFFISYLGDGYFRRTQATACCSWQDPAVEDWQGRPSVVVTISNYGYNRENATTKKIRYLLQSGEAVKVEEGTQGYLVALAELRYSDFTEGREDEVLTLRYDLNGDGFPDELYGKPWDRWGAITWYAAISNIHVAPKESNLGCRRLGVLSSMTNGVHDLVCDESHVLRWVPQARMWE